VVLTTEFNVAFPWNKCLPKWKREREIGTLSLLSFKKWLLLNKDHLLFIWQEAAHNLDHLLCFLECVDET